MTLLTLEVVREILKTNPNGWGYSRRELRYLATLEKALEVVRAANMHMCSSREEYPDPDEDLIEALKPFGEGDGNEHSG